MALIASKFKQIQDAMLSLLTTTISNVPIVTNTKRPMSQDVNLQIRLLHNQATPKISELSSDLRINWEGSVFVHCLARKTIDGEADAVADDLFRQVWNQLQTDKYLGGALIEPLEFDAIGWADDELDTSVSAVFMKANYKFVSTNNEI